MGDHDRRPTVQSGLERGLDVGFVVVVEVARRLVEDHDGGILQQQPGDRDALLLAAAQAVPAFADDGVVAVGEGDNGVVDAGGTARRLELILRCVMLGVAQVVTDRLVEQVRVL